MDELKRAYDALKIISLFNRMNNDTDAYLYEVCEWGLAGRDEEPNPKDYGIND